MKRCGKHRRMHTIADPRMSIQAGAVNYLGRFEIDMCTRCGKILKGFFVTARITPVTTFEKFDPNPPVIIEN